MVEERYHQLAAGGGGPHQILQEDRGNRDDQRPIRLGIRGSPGMRREDLCDRRDGRADHELM